MKVLKKTDIVYEPLAVTIGKFDGFHIGHQKLLVNVSGQKEIKSLVIIIRDKHDSFIFSNDEIMEYLSSFNIDYVYWLEFDEKIRQMQAEEFIRVLCQKYNIKTFVIGEDFRFGNCAAGDSVLIKNLGVEYKYSVIVCDFVFYHNSKVSSSLIRDYLKIGDISNANLFLGRNYYIRGKVVRGNGIGTDIGYPTANINMYKIFPCNGVYYTKCIINNTQYDSITNIGTKPTVSNNDIVNAETFIIDFSGELYNCIISIEFICFIRHEMKFPTLELLTEQIHKDLLAVKKYIK